MVGAKKYSDDMSPDYLKVLGQPKVLNLKGLPKSLTMFARDPSVNIGTIDLEESCDELHYVLKGKTTTGCSIASKDGSWELTAFQAITVDRDSGPSINLSEGNTMELQECDIINFNGVGSLLVNTVNEEEINMGFFALEA